MGTPSKARGVRTSGARWPSSRRRAGPGTASQPSPSRARRPSSMRSAVSWGCPSRRRGHRPSRSTTAEQPVPQVALALKAMTPDAGGHPGRRAVQDHHHELPTPSTPRSCPGGRPVPTRPARASAAAETGLHPSGDGCLARAAAGRVARRIGPPGEVAAGTAPAASVTGRTATSGIMPRRCGSRERRGRGREPVARSTRCGELLGIDPTDAGPSVGPSSAYDPPNLSAAWAYRPRRVHDRRATIARRPIAAHGGCLTWSKGTSCPA